MVKKEIVLQGRNPFLGETERMHMHTRLAALHGSREAMLQELQGYRAPEVYARNKERADALMQLIIQAEAEMRVIAYELSDKRRTVLGRFSVDEVEAYGYTCTYTTAEGRCGKSATHCEGMRVRCDEHPVSVESPVKGPKSFHSHVGFGNPDLPCTCVVGQPPNPNCLRHGRRN
ncbi:hypothetical protein K2P56_00335 [Patescibacteria group bacterium]|nr:hypothetical protein [Patescibacteria group bacterium]